MLTITLQIFNNVLEGPGSETTKTYTLEIAIMLVVSFILGFLFRYFLAGLANKKAEPQAIELPKKAEPQESKNVSYVDNTPKNNNAELSRLKSDLAEANAMVASLKAQPNNTATLESVKKELDLKVTEVVSLKTEISNLKVEIEALSMLKPPTVITKVVHVQKDELKKIEGIGPKIQQLLYDAEITTFKQLSETPVEKIKEILMAAGERYKIHDPSTWPQQSALAAENKWDELRQMQDNLIAGKD